MKPVIFLSLFFVFVNGVFAQYNLLLLKKNGITVKSYKEGSVITIQTTYGLRYTGTIYLLQKDSIYFHESRIHINQVAAIYKKNRRYTGNIIPFDKTTFLYANLGIGIFVAGLTISGANPLQAIATGVGIVYMPILTHNIRRLLASGNKRLQIGKTYTLQVLDLYAPEKVPVSY